MYKLILEGHFIDHIYILNTTLTPTWLPLVTNFVCGVCGLDLKAQLWKGVTMKEDMA